jgi:hypothetical protein
MKKLTTLLLLVLPFLTNAQYVDTSGVEWLKTEHHFGKVTLDSPATYKFKFVNKSKKTAEIISVEASCGCTQPTWTQTMILPGDTAFVEATYNSKVEGVFKKQVTIHTNLSPFPTNLFLMGEVVKPK